MSVKSRRVARKGKEEVKTRRKSRGTEEEENRGAGASNTVKGNRVVGAGRGDLRACQERGKEGKEAPHHGRAAPPLRASPAGQRGLRCLDVSPAFVPPHTP